MSSRNCIVDLVKFVGALLIMTHHLYIIGFSDYYFRDSWIYVEMFLIITGYYTAKHFEGKKYANPMKESIIYTLKKFVPLFPYTIIATLLLYSLTVLQGFISDKSAKDFLFGFIDDFLYDILLIIDVYKRPLVGPLWFLSAMFIVFPLFSYLLQISNRYWIITISILYFLFYYGFSGLLSEPLDYNDFLRVLAGLCVGVFVYEFSYIFYDYLIGMKKSLLAIIEIVTFILPIILSFGNFGMFRLILLCFTVCSVIMLPDFSYINIQGNRVCSYLGKLSMVIFVFHFVIARLIEFLCSKYLCSICIKLILYYGITVLTSVFVMFLIDHWEWYQEMVKKPILLKD